MVGIDTPSSFQEIVKYLSANSAAGSSMTDDGERYIYYLISATLFYRIDTWKGCQHQQLANPTGTFGAGTTLKYTKQVWSQLNWVVYGSVYGLITSGTGLPTYTRYDIASNTWVVQNVTNLPATFGTDSYICFPSPELNNNTGWYHAGVIQTITTTGDVAIGATSIPVSALPIALAANTILNFGTMASPKYAVLTASAAAAATSITVTALSIAIGSSSSAPWYWHMYLIGNALAVMYRWQLATSTWSATSANSGNPVFPAIPANVWAGLALKWLPWLEDVVWWAWWKDRLVLMRGAASNNFYYYDLVANTFTAITYTPNTETFTTGCMCTTLLDDNNKPYRIIISGSVLTIWANIRILELDILKWRMNIASWIDIIPTWALLVGDRLASIKSRDWIQQLFIILHTSNIMIKDSSIMLLT